MNTTLIHTVIPRVFALVLLLTLSACAASSETKLTSMDVYKAAQRGEAEAQYALGNIYNNGQIVKQDFDKALEWWTKAAKKGHAYSFNNIGLLYASGNIEQNFLLAYTNLLIADALGCEASADNMALIKDKLTLVQIKDALLNFNTILKDLNI